MESDMNYQTESKHIELARRLADRAEETERNFYAKFRHIQEIAEKYAIITDRENTQYGSNH